MNEILNLVLLLIETGKFRMRPGLDGNRVFSCGYTIFELLRDPLTYNRKLDRGERSWKKVMVKWGVVITKEEMVEKEEGKGQNGKEPKLEDRGKEKKGKKKEGKGEEVKEKSNKGISRRYRYLMLLMGEKERTEQKPQDLMIRRKYIWYEGKKEIAVKERMRK